MPCARLCDRAGRSVVKLWFQSDGAAEPPSSPRGRCRGARAGGGLGGGREPADDERGEQQLGGLDRAEVVDGDPDGPPTPAFAVEDCELALAVGQGVALAPGAGGPKRELASGPADGSSAPHPAWLVLPDRRPDRIGCLNRASPEAAVRE